MKSFEIYCEQCDFSRLAAAFLPEINCNCPLACEIVFTDEQGIRQLNNSARGVDAVTDVLSFPALSDILGKRIVKSRHITDVDEQGNLFLGSIVICEKRAAEQAEEYGHSYERELNYLAAHGVCHLLGYDHIEESDKAKMREVEERVLTSIGITR